jgi:hypothetical protein
MKTGGAGAFACQRLIEFAVALTHELVLVTGNQKHFPMPELRLPQLPGER